LVWNEQAAIPRVAALTGRLYDDGGEGGGPMVKLHMTRLMPAGTVLLWLEGRIVWDGAVGAVPDVASFDAISLNIADGARLEDGASPESIRELLAT